jgi:hypothetical protein
MRYGVVLYSDPATRWRNAYRSVLVVVLGDNKIVRHGTDKGTGVIRNGLVAVEDNIERYIGTVLGASVVPVLREDGTVEVKPGKEAMAA